VLAVSEGYEWEQVEPFFASLRASGFDGDVHVFAPRTNADTLMALRAFGADVSRPRRFHLRIGDSVFRPYEPSTARVHWHAQPLYRHVIHALGFLSRDHRVATARLAGAVSNVDVARYFWYFLHLSRNAGRYRNVMLTDVRDVVFLGNPFSFDIGDSVFFFLEHERLRLRDNPHNRVWLDAAYGPDVLAELGDLPISCSGVTIGAAPAITAYLAAMVDGLAQLPRQYTGIDQGVHNYLVHKGLVPNSRLMPNRAGPVLTVGLMPDAAAARAIEEGRTRIRVVHQYDRHPELAALIQEDIGPLSSRGPSAEHQ
jgi:hypothetical protein